MGARVRERARARAHAHAHAGARARTRTYTHTRIRACTRITRKQSPCQWQLAYALQNWHAACSGQGVPEWHGALPTWRATGKAHAKTRLEPCGRFIGTILAQALPCAGRWSARLFDKPNDERQGMTSALLPVRLVLIFADDTPDLSFPLEPYTSIKGTLCCRIAAGAGFPSKTLGGSVVFYRRGSTDPVKKLVPSAKAAIASKATFDAWRAISAEAGRAPETVARAAWKAAAGTTGDAEAPEAPEAPEGA